MGEVATQIIEKGATKAAQCVSEKAAKEILKKAAENAAKKVIPVIGQISTGASIGQAGSCFWICE